MKYLNLLVCITALAYIAIRTITVGITYDEVWTLTYFAKRSIFQIVSANPPYANNHILNTLLVKFCTLFSDSEFAIRLPNLLAGALYIYSTYKISHLLTENKIMRTALIISLLTNYTLLHFFGLARGYGLGIGFMLYAIYNSMYYAKQCRLRNIHLSFMAGFLAAYSNFTLSVPFTVIIGVNSWLLYKQKNNLKHTLIIPAIYTLVFLLILAYPIYKIKQAGEMYFGGDSSFYNDTYKTLMQDYFGHTPLYSYSGIINLTYATLVCIAIIVIIIKIILKKYDSISIPVVIFATTATSIICQFYLLNSKFIIYRGALYLFPLLILTIYSLFLTFGTRKFLFLGIPLAMLTASIGIYNFAKEANFYTTREWWDECYNKHVVDYIAKQEADNQSVINVYTSFALDNSLNYYATRKYPSRFKQIEPNHGMDDSILEQYDYVYLPVHAYKVPEYLPLKPVFAYQDSTYILYRNTTR